MRGGAQTRTTLLHLPVLSGRACQRATFPQIANQSDWPDQARVVQPLSDLASTQPSAV